MKKKTKRSTKQVEGLSQQEEIAHYVGVLVEDMESKFTMVIEKVDGLEERLNQKIDTKFAEQDLRFDRIEFVLGYHGDMLNGHGKTLDNHTEILNEHTKVLAEHTHILNDHTKVLTEHTHILNDHSKTLSEHSKTLNEHSESLGRLETKFDVLAKKVSQHDEAIKEIQQNLIS